MRLSPISVREEGCGTLCQHPYPVWEAEERSTDINYCKSINIDTDTQPHVVIRTQRTVETLTIHTYTLDTKRYIIYTGNYFMCSGLGGECMQSHSVSVVFRKLEFDCCDDRQ